MGKNKWVYGFYAMQSFGIGFFPSIIQYNGGSSMPEKVIPETVGQYTGLKDKNGVKIFEGDIVKDDYGNIGTVTYLEHFCNWRIVFHKGRPDLLGKYGCNIFDWIYPDMNLEIIGNIHDNPELLEQYNE